MPDSIAIAIICVYPMCTSSCCESNFRVPLNIEQQSYECIEMTLSHRPLLFTSIAFVVLKAIIVPSMTRFVHVLHLDRSPTFAATCTRCGHSRCGGYCFVIFIPVGGINVRQQIFECITGISLQRPSFLRLLFPPLTGPGTKLQQQKNLQGGEAKPNGIRNIDEGIIHAQLAEDPP